MARTTPIRLRTVAATIVVVASGLMIFHAYQSIIGSSDNTVQSVPLIKAETKPFRIVPDNAGGAEIPGKDSTLFRMLDQNESDPLALSGAKVQDAQDTIVPQSSDRDDEPVQGFQLPEIPEPRSESLYGMIDELKESDTPVEAPVNQGDDSDNSAEANVSTNTPEKDQGYVPLDKDSKVALQEKLKDVIAEQAQAVKVDESAIDTKTDQSTDNTVKEKAAIVSPLPVSKPPQKKTVIQAKPASVNTTKQMPERSASESVAVPPKANDQTPVIRSYYIQLASLRDEAAARNTYERIRQNFPQLVQGVGVRYPTADLGARGVFTRIQVGPLPKAEAQKRCDAYSSDPNGGTCLVISR